MMAQSSESIVAGPVGPGVDLPGLVGMLAGAAERVSSTPERAEAELRRVVSETRALLALGRVVLKAEISERRVVQFGEGDPAPDAAVEEVPIMRGARGRFGRLFLRAGGAGLGGAGSRVAGGGFVGARVHVNEDYAG